MHIKSAFLKLPNSALCTILTMFYNRPYSFKSYFWTSLHFYNPIKNPRTISCRSPFHDLRIPNQLSLWICLFWTYPINWFNHNVWFLCLVLPLTITFSGCNYSVAWICLHFIPFYGHMIPHLTGVPSHIPSLSTHQLVDIWVVFTFWVLQQGCFKSSCASFCVDICSLWAVTYLKVELRFIQ